MLTTLTRSVIGDGGAGPHSGGGLEVIAEGGQADLAAGSNDGARAGGV
jgi:hypothetical protein